MAISVWSDQRPSKLIRGWALCIALFLGGCHAGAESNATPPPPSAPAPAPPSAPAPAPAPAPPGDLLTGRVWTRTDAPELPGQLLIFLPDGTLVQDSCWETYRLSAWRWEDERTLVWKEDTMDIRARVVELSAEELVLRLELVSEVREETFRVASVPYVCPDMPR